jgi:hypothetical protein
MDSNEQLQYHENTEPFREAINFTESNTRFSARLIEKDYYCSLVLRGMAEAFQQGLIFKGGTCLSKVHSDFYRLSEDLDFVISMETNASWKRTPQGPLVEHESHRCKTLSEVFPNGSHVFMRMSPPIRF